MSPLTIGLLALGMSVDAFIASVGRGATRPRPGLLQALGTGAVFGAVEAVTPLIGWGLGMLASGVLAQVDHWIAFGLLCAVGARMILGALRGHDADEPASRPGRAAGWALLVTAIGTSIDAMAVGVSLAFLEVNILVIAAAIGAATMLMSTTGILAGRLIGRRFGYLAEIGGGVVLILLGSSILLRHLTA